MIFHRINFLDIRKIEYFCEEYLDINPYFMPEHLFILSSMYLVEVGFDQNSCGVRICKEKGKWNEYPLFKKELFYQKYEDLCYTYSVDCFTDHRKYKKYHKMKKSLLKKNEYELRVLKKEDFPSIVLFMQEYYKSIGKLNETPYFLMLSKLKFIFEHLYELKMDAVSIYLEDELKGIYVGFHNKGYYIIESMLVLEEFEPVILDYAIMIAGKNKEKIVFFEKIEDILKCLR